MDSTATIIQDGTGQEERMATALRPGYFRPDEMSLPDLLFLASRFASQLAYFNADNKPRGDWQPLFTNDASALLGEVLVEATRPDAWQRMFTSFLVKVQGHLMKLTPCPPPETVPVYRLEKLFRRWVADCKYNHEPATQRLGETLEGLMTAHLEPALAAVATYLSRYDKRHGDFVPQSFRNGAHCEGIQLPPPNAPFDTVTHFLSDSFSAYINALTVIRKIAEEQFPQSLSSGRHDPAAGLYLAFAQLYLKSKKSIDDFSQRQLRFYYDRVLRFRRQPAQGDNAYLVFVPDGTMATAPVPANTQFIGGEDAGGKAQLYISEDELAVTDARVVSLKTLYFDRDPLHSSEKELGYVTSARTTSIPTVADGHYYSLFGASRKKGEAAASKDVRLGFAIASPVLLLHEGVREITIDLHFEQCAENIDWLIKKLCGLVKGKVASTEGMFYKAFANAFRIRLTTAEGWSDVPVFIPGCHLVDGDVASDCLRIEISLPENYPPVVAHNPKIHTGTYGTEGAVISFELQPDTYLYPYDFLSRQLLRWVDISVKVSGCRNLALYNNNGELSAAATFAPFGPLPKVGSHLIVGSKEAFSKQLTGLELTVEWDGLPANGLENHYRAYDSGIEAASFRVVMSALSDRAWIPDKPAERIELPLFEGEYAERARYDGSSLLPYMRTVEPASSGYGQNASGGFIRLTLAAPSQAFGHAEYPQLLAKALTRNSRLDALGPVWRIVSRKGMLPIPETPYTPQISAIALNYSARARISPHLSSSASARERFYHLHPFGIEAISLSTHGETTLIPVSPQGASLYIGIDASELCGPLNLYFHLRNDSTLDPGKDAPLFNWYCLNGNRWQPLEEYRILEDTTRGFLVSGVVRLDLPCDLVRGETHMSGGHYWLRVATDRAASELCSVYAVYSHGLRVSRVIDQSSPQQVNVLPAGTIKAAKKALPGIGAILQPADSFGGQQRESEEAMTIRASERLRHRQRAVSPWDYERLVLQRFPRLHKVKCFPHTVFSENVVTFRDPQPGNVLIVVVPQHADHQRNSGQALKENILLLQDIKDYLEKRTSQFVKIDVRNPVYERIQVRCAVKFHGAGSEGMHLKQLNREIGNYISPWNNLGNSANFGWSLRAQEIQGYLHGLPYVQSIWGLSMLRVVENNESHYTLTDTAKQEGLAELTPLYPWSLAVPFRHHLIELDEKCLPDPKGGPWKSGISRLQVGTTFIISGKRNGENR